MEILPFSVMELQCLNTFFVPTNHAFSPQILHSTELHCPPPRNSEKIIFDILTPLTNLSDIVISRIKVLRRFTLLAFTANIFLHYLQYNACL